MWSKEEIDLLISNIDQYVKVLLLLTPLNQAAFGLSTPFG